MELLETLFCTYLWTSGPLFILEFCNEIYYPRRIILNQFSRNAEICVWIVIVDCAELYKGENPDNISWSFFPIFSR